MPAKSPAKSLSHPIPAGLSRSQLLELYYWMALTRALEERLVSLHRQGKVVGGLFRSLGQEADAVGSAYALDRTRGDILSPLIRNLGSMLVQGATPLEVLRQYMAKKESPTRGRELNIHFNDLHRGFLGQISPLGDMVPVMAGVALSFRMNGEARVGMVYVGDGAMSTGTFHEGMSLVAAQRLPLVVVCERNGYAFSTPHQAQTAVAELRTKALAYGIPSLQADGNDVIAVYEVSREAVDRARSGGGPTLIELITFRRRGHAEHDNQSYMPPGLIEEWEKKDPIERYKVRLGAHGWVTTAELLQADDRIAAELDAAVARCLDEPQPSSDMALAGVLAEPAAADAEWYRSARG
ncbi:MAG TPA: thiamine pyrophosphate-dependent dehydrogenase E1 component subunit alpha [Gemmatimonadales bacterium]|nr:thiamine pyrophosphate-dependent dehydrogenase E1 component subunit alpha [Gemmatimonadales bacterium]